MNGEPRSWGSAALPLLIIIGLGLLGSRHGPAGPDRHSANDVGFELLKRFPLTANDEATTARVDICLRRPLRRPRSTADAAARKRGLQRDPTASAFPRLGTLGFGSHRSARAPIAGFEPDVEDLAQTIVSAVGDLHSSVGPQCHVA